jgi:hypothetical protein
MDHCSDILAKALQILDGLTSFHTEIIGMPTWPSALTARTTLFLFKLYLSNKLLDIYDLISYFNIPSENIVLVGTKNLTGLTPDEEAANLIESLKLPEIDMDDDLQNTIIREARVNFDQILRISTTGIWSTYTEIVKQSMATPNLKSKMQALETINATESTALAICQATENINNIHPLNLSTNLRVNNLENFLESH